MNIVMSFQVLWEVTVKKCKANHLLLPAAINFTVHGGLAGSGYYRSFFKIGFLKPDNCFLTFIVTTHSNQRALFN